MRKVNIRTIIRVAGAIAFCSALFYAITGLTLWAPAPKGEDGRTAILVIFHIGAMLAAAFSYIDE